MRPKATSILEDATGSESGPDRILRFRRSERELHWALAVPFLTCYATAAILVAVYNPDPTRPYREVISWIHRVSGLCLIVLPPLVLARHRHDLGVHVANIREGWTWTLDDLKWLCLIGPSTFNTRIALPDQGKFNAGEKINFTVLMATYPLYGITGILIWLPGVAIVAWFVHLSLAATATPLLFGHLFMALVNPASRVGLRGMFTGFVDRDWARHHYRRWYDRTFGDEPEVLQPALTAEPEDSCPAVPSSHGPAMARAGLRIRGLDIVPGTDAVTQECAAAAPEAINRLPGPARRDAPEASGAAHRHVRIDGHPDDRSASSGDLVPSGA
jgi:formate dehydrogenase subunit gamma